MPRLSTTAARVLPVPSRISRRERRSSEIRERLFRAALALFAERGYLATTVEDITEAADVGKGTFFNYFPTKEHVLATYGAERIAAIERALEKARASQGSVLPVLRELVTDLAGQSAQSPDLLRSIFAAHLSCAPIRAELQKRTQRARRLMAGIFELGQQSGEIRGDLTAAALGRLTHMVFMGLTIAWSLNPDSPLRKSSSEVWELLLANLCVERGRRQHPRHRRANKGKE